VGRADLRTSDESKAGKMPTISASRSLVDFACLILSHTAPCAVLNEPGDWIVTRCCWRWDILSIKEIKVLVAREAGDSRGQDHVLVNAPVWRGRNAFVYKVEAPWLPGTAALKACREWTTGKPDAAAARRQFVALTNVEEKFGRDGRFRVPAPYALFEQHAAYLAEWIEGTSMARALSARMADEPSAVRLVLDAGAWLRRFHASNEACHGRVDVEAQLSELVAGSRDSLIAGRRRRDSASLAALRAMAPEIADIEVARSWVHGDFKPDNLLVTHDCIYAIDVAASDANIIGFDIALFLNGLAAVANDSHNSTLVGCLPALEDAFWQGYGGPELALRRVVTWLRISLLLEARAAASARAAARTLLHWLTGTASDRNTLERLTRELCLPIVRERAEPTAAS